MRRLPFQYNALQHIKTRLEKRTWSWGACSSVPESRILLRAMYFSFHVLILHFIPVLIIFPVPKLILISEWVFLPSMWEWQWDVLGWHIAGLCDLWLPPAFLFVLMSQPYLPSSPTFLLYLHSMAFTAFLPLCNSFVNSLSKWNVIRMSTSQWSLRIRPL